MRTFRCSDGHVFTLSITAMLLSVKFTTTRRLARCPVDHRWRMMDRVQPADLSEAEPSRAQRNAETQ
jgi:hypothetical protein